MCILIFLTTTILTDRQFYFLLLPMDLYETHNFEWITGLPSIEKVNSQFFCLNSYRRHLQWRGKFTFSLLCNLFRQLSCFGRYFRQFLDSCNSLQTLFFFKPWWSKIIFDTFFVVVVVFYYEISKHVQKQHHADGSLLSLHYRFLCFP